jgi:hypothetical protein
MVGRERLPLATFRTDDWPIPEGVNYSKEAETRCRENLDRLKAEAEKQALDRKIRQMMVDLPKLENELELRKNGSSKRLIESEISRLEAILDELQTTDEWLSNRIRGQYPDLAEKVRATREAVEALKSVAEAIEEGK